MAAAAASDASHVKMTGKWKPNIARSDDFEPFMAYVGVPWLVRKAVKRSAPIMELAITEKTFQQTTSGAMGKKFVNEGPFGTVSRVRALRKQPCADSECKRPDGFATSRMLHIC